MTTIAPARSTAPLFVSMMLIAACGGNEGTTEIPATEIPGPTGSWRLTAFADEPAPRPSRITLSFTEDGRIQGSGGCNKYFSSYRVDVPGSLSVARLGATRMACSGDAMATEQRFFTALEAARSYRMTDERLEILDDNGNLALVFEPDPDSGPGA